MAAHIHEWDIVIAGFLQREGTPNGMIGLWQTLHALHACPQRAVVFRTWNSEWRDLATLIFRTRDAAAQPTVKVYAYSYGAGFGAVQLAEELKKRGLGVRHMVLSDAVYRSACLFGRLSALLPFASIEVPDNVRRVTWFRQAKNRPMGHEVFAADPARTKVDPATWASVPHQAMDDLVVFHQECRRIAKQL